VQQPRADILVAFWNMVVATQVHRLPNDVKVCIKTEYAHRRSPRKHHTTSNSIDTYDMYNVQCIFYRQSGLCSIEKAIVLADEAGMAPLARQALARRALARQALERQG
jgi:hypothetical protein